ncbi:homocysteine S-methyltransferase family protein [Salinibacter grassmerensis]|uniref:homocysteine S-methyltransferase family protein n=1 Tax=Salinibacter grassmerensis TaxID=3040353 RepID=UPI0021E8C57E|nr:homocysteine S-methyltransferase family protein [Salinibacter grassmerensis]
MKNLLTRPSGNPVLLDGGLGQELIRRGMLDTEPSLWSANALTEAPDLVQEVHEDYLRAGADVITTNTYATPPERLSEAGLEGRAEALNQKAGRLAERARAAVGQDALIAGSLPPIRGSYRPDLVGEMDEIEPQYREQAGYLAPHVDFFLCETMSTPGEAQAAARGAASTGCPVLVSYTIADPSSPEEAEPRLRDGRSLEEAVEALSGLPVEGILLNCSYPESISAAVPVLRELTDRPVGAYANAFTHIPDDFDEHADALNSGARPEQREDLSPEAYAKHVENWLSAGADIVGGCCEVGPGHVAHLRTMIDSAADTRRAAG